MSTPYPVSKDDGTTLPYPSSTDTLSSPNLSSGQDNQNDSVIAIETLLGTNSTQTSPVANTVLTSPSNGTNEWQSITSSFVSGSTGTGNFVLASSPTISSPTISSPTISSPTITGSLGNISTGTITASGAVTASSTLAVTGSLTASGGITTTGFTVGTPPIWQYLGSAQITSTITTTSSTFTLATGLSVSVTVPSGATALKVTFKGITQNNTSGDICAIGIDVGGTIIDQMYMNEPGAAYNQNLSFSTIQKSPTSGSTTVSIQFSNNGSGTASIVAGSAGTTPNTPGPAYILVEAC